ncbi:MAG: hypothetical protein WAX77_00680 [Methylococcaceae bacterium]
MNDLPNMDNHILPECFLDTNLVETLVPPINTYNHQTSNGAVAKAMRSAELNNKFAIGVIDRDKQELPYLKEFDLLATKHEVGLYKHPMKHHYMIVHPPLEKWIMAECNAVNLDIHQYVEFSDFKIFKKIAKTRTSKDDKNFKSLFEDLRANNAKGIIQLSNWLNYLKKHSYNANINELKNLP